VDDNPGSVGTPLRRGLVRVVQAEIEVAGQLVQRQLQDARQPMLILGGSDDYVGGADGWTVRSANGRRAAHSEHTVAIMEDGPVVLTLP